jgi:hypothetical protein
MSPSNQMYLDRFADAFAAAGLSSVVFDNHNFGASDCEPRQDIDPWRQVRDYRDAITYAETLGETDSDRIGVWGSSYSGGHVLVVGAIDRRVNRRDTWSFMIACGHSFPSRHDGQRPPRAAAVKDGALAPPKGSSLNGLRARRNNWAFAWPRRFGVAKDSPEEKSGNAYAFCNRRCCFAEAVIRNSDAF